MPFYSYCALPFSFSSQLFSFRVPFLRRFLCSLSSFFPPFHCLAYFFASFHYLTL
jgi:hypothetical protein